LGTCICKHRRLLPALQVLGLLMSASVTATSVNGAPVRRAEKFKRRLSFESGILH